MNTRCLSSQFWHPARRTLCSPSLTEDPCGAHYFYSTSVIQDLVVPDEPVGRERTAAKNNDAISMLHKNFPNNHYKLLLVGWKWWGFMNVSPNDKLEEELFICKQVRVPLIDVLESDLIRHSFRLFQKEDDPRCPVGPLFCQIDPRRQSIPVEDDLIGPQQTTCQQRCRGLGPSQVTGLLIITLYLRRLLHPSCASPWS